MQTQTLVISIDNSIDTRRLNTKFRVFKSEMLGLKPGVSLSYSVPKAITAYFHVRRPSGHRCNASMFKFVPDKFVEPGFEFQI